MKRTVITVLLAVLLATPAAATPANSEKMPVGLDIATRVLFGIPLTVLGAVAMIPVGLATAVTRPSEIRKPYEMLVVAPAHYTWGDSLGNHPNPDPPTAPIFGQ